jgi:lysophospholipase L1-like esterase
MRTRSYTRCVLGVAAAACMMVAAQAQAPPGQIPPGPIPTPQALKHSVVPLQPIMKSAPVDFGLTATVTSPISVSLGWKTVAGATGYTVLRNGVILSDLPVNARSFADNTVTPQTKYSYQLRADGLSLMVNGHSTGFPLDSAAAQVEPPLPLPPPGLTAMLQAGNRVQLTWTGRPEATAYQILRAGQTFTVAATAQNSFIDTNPGSGDVQYAIATVVHTAAGNDVPGYPGPLLGIRLRPFNIVVAGDSVVWGQGLADANKFSSKVKLWLGMQLAGRELTPPANHAHSGAIIGDLPDDSDRPRDAITNANGEIPESYPSVLNQAMALARNDLELAHISLTDVDLILMDGCANDVNLGNVLTPWTKDADIASRALTYCYQQMISNLMAIHGVYPNAKIVVTGYYAIVSSKSDPLAVTAFTTALLGPAGLAAGVAAWEQAIDHTTAFFNNSDAMLRSAVITANSQIPGAPIRYVAPGFDPTNAYAAPNTFTWLIPSPPTPPFLFDEVFWARQSICHSMGKNMPGDCPAASGGHPNVLGAQAYANAVTGALGDFMPQWKSQFAMVQHAP